MLKKEVQMFLFFYFFHLNFKLINVIIITYKKNYTKNYTRDFKETSKNFVFL